MAIGPDANIYESQQMLEICPKLLSMLNQNLCADVACACSCLGQLLPLSRGRETLKAGSQPKVMLLSKRCSCHAQCSGSLHCTLQIFCLCVIMSLCTSLSLNKHWQHCWFKLLMVPVALNRLAFCEGQDPPAISLNGTQRNQGQPDHG